MPISIVVGGQFGSEGKGKIALEIVRRANVPVSTVRVGGPNSGHTAYDRLGRRWALRQMPASCIDRNVDVVFPAGSYLDLDVLFKEIEELQYPLDRIFVHPFANLIKEEHRAWEREAGLVRAIGSTGSGVGGAVMAAVAREALNFPLRAYHAQDDARLAQFICPTSEFLQSRLSSGWRVVIEGSQGFGLSLLEGGYWPKVTARSTTAAAALAEAGLSPREVDDVTLVLRTYPIRVAGESGPLVGETTWSEIAQNVGRNEDLREYTTVTNKLRRVGNFDGLLVKKAIAANRPDRLVLNHLDYIGSEQTWSNRNSATRAFVRRVETELECKVDWVGFDPLGVLENVESFLA